MERSESLRNVTGTAIGIRQNGWRALDQLGVGDVLRENAILIPRERFVGLHGGKQLGMSLKGEARCLRRKDLIDTLYDALPPDTVKFGCELDSIKLDPITTKPVLRFIDRSSIIAKAVIGCEGGKSVTASFLNLKPTKNFPICAVRGLSNYPNGHPIDHEFARFKKDNYLVGIYPIDNNLVYWFCGKPYDRTDKSIWEDPEAIRQSTVTLLTDFPQEIKEMIKIADAKSLSFTHLRYRAPWDMVMGTFCNGTVTVAGDAMHVMGPFLEQGGSAGLEDVIVLARNLSEKGLENVEEAFKQYVKERRMRLVRLSLQTYITGMLTVDTSSLKKHIFLVLLSTISHNMSDHVVYDCGGL